MSAGTLNWPVLLLVGIEVVLILVYLLGRGWRWKTTHKIAMALAVVGIWLMGSAIIRYINRDTIALTVGAHVADYTSALEPGLTYVSDEEPGYTTGKLVLVNRRGDEEMSREVIQLAKAYFLDLENNMNSDEFRLAHWHNEVGTVIWVDCWKEHVATYSSGAKGYRPVCDVTVIDFGRSAVIERKVFEGQDPPSAKWGSADIVGEPPQGANIAKYIASLPWRK